MTILKIALVGIGATIAIDAWGFLLSLFKITSLDYRYVGRWVAHFPQGKFVHENIMKSAPVRGEVMLGWTVHFLSGISFAFLLVLVYGIQWLEAPLLLPALIIGIATVCAPLLIMQPAFGFGFGSSKLPKPNIRRLKSLSTHAAYGFGLYLTALLVNLLWN